MHLRQRIQRYADGHPGLPDGTRPEERLLPTGRGDRGAASVRNRDLRLGGRTETVSRRDVFTDGPYALHACAGEEITVEAQTDAEILVQCTKNDTAFSGRLYRPEDAPWVYSCVGKFGNVAKRRVNTIFDKDIAPLVQYGAGRGAERPGELVRLSAPPAPPAGVLLLQVRPAGGFGASFVGDQVFKSVATASPPSPAVPASPGSGAGLPDCIPLDDSPSGR